MLDYVWMLPFVPLTIFWLTEPRRARRRERERRAWAREWDHAIIYAQFGKLGLEQRLIDDLRQVLLQRALKESNFDMNYALDMYRKSKGNRP